ncbi:MAG: hypothetical protein HY553_05760, partial [Elusimicrobia bacterium]|nr:hypothetical protein [Elusimicrobiota bacterium]
WTAGEIPSLDASKIGSGTFGDERVAISTAAVTGGKWTDAHIAAGAAIAKSKIDPSTPWSAGEIPSLDASKIGTGTFGDARVAVSTAAVTSGQWTDAHIAPTAAIAQTKISGLGTDLGAKVSRNGDSMTGALTLVGSTLTVQGNAFSVGGSTLAVQGGGVGIGTAAPGEALHVAEGNVLLSGSGERELRMQRTGLENNPAFKLGRIVTAGDGSPEFRVLYSDDATSERSVFEFDNKGIVASVKTAVGSHFEGFLAGDVEPMFRLNSFPQMQLELGAGGAAPTDVAMRRSAPGTLSMLTNGIERARIGTGLVVAATMTVQGEAFSVGGSTLAVSAGRIGIGTSAPVYRLDVVRTTDDPYPLRVYAPASSNQVDGSIILEHAGSGDPALSFWLTGDDKYTLGIDNSDGNKFKLTKGGTLGIGGADYLVVDGNGRMGVGAAAPGARLDVEGSAQFGSTAKSTFTAAGGLALASGQNVTLAGGGTVTGLAGPSAASDAATKSWVESTIAAGGGGWTDGGTVVSLGSPADNVVIQSTLTVQGAAFSVGASTLAVTQGRVGIGTTAPDFPLHVVSDGSDLVELKSGGANAYLWLENASSMRNSLSLDTGGHLYLGGASSGRNVIVRGAGTGFDTIATFERTGRVGVGAGSPSARLHVSSVSAVAGDTLLLVSSGAAASQGLLAVRGDGKVGIGMTSPTSNLHVRGDYDITPELTLTDGANSLTFSATTGQSALGGSGSVIIDANQSIILRSATNRQMELRSGVDVNSLNFNSYDLSSTINTSGAQGYTGLRLNVSESATGTGSNRLLDIQKGGASQFAIFNTGKAGVGTTAPQARLEVKPAAEDGYALWVSSQDASALLRVSGAGDVLVGAPAVHDTTAAADLLVEGNLIVDGQIVQHQGTGGEFQTLAVSTGIGAGQLFKVAAGTFTVLESGRVGIGTASPGVLLDVNSGSVNAIRGVAGGLGAVAVSASAANSGYGFRTDDSPVGYYFGNAAGYAVYVANAGARSVTAGSWMIGSVNNADRQVEIVDSAAPQLRLTSTENSVYTDLRTTGAGSLSVVPSGGQVGIGTASPGAALDVEGTAQFGSTAKSTFTAAGGL